MDGPGRVKLDQGSEELLMGKENRVDQALSAPQRGLMYAEKAFESSPSESKGLGQDPAFIQALHNQYYGKQSKQIDALKRQAGMQGQMDKAGALKNLSAIAQGQQQALTQQFQFLTNAYNQQESAKAGAINQLFQTGQNIMGHYYANKEKQAPGIKTDFKVGGYSQTGDIDSLGQNIGSFDV